MYKIPDHTCGVYIHTNKACINNNTLEQAEIDIWDNAVNAINIESRVPHHNSYVLGFNGYGNQEYTEWLGTYYFLVYAYDPQEAVQKMWKHFNANKFFDVNAVERAPIYFVYDVQLISRRY